MEYKINEIIEFIYDNKTIKLKIEKSPTGTCKNCFFFDKNRCLKSKYNLQPAYCGSILRIDKNNVIYRQI